MMKNYENFVTKNWVKVNNLSSGQYSVNKNTKFKTWMLRSDLCDYSDAYIVVKGTITVEGTNYANKKNKKVTSRVMLHLDHENKKSITH